MRNTTSLRSCLFALFLGGGCGDTTLVCHPSCPPGSHCAESGCVPDHAPADLSAVTGGDMASACAPACSAGFHCNATHMCVVCLADADCPAGKVCRPSGATTVCVPGCADDSRCAGADVGDGGAGAAMKCCGGQCVDATRDPQNCGGCATPCGVQHSSALCLNGACKPGKCDPGWGDCNNKPDDGCETNLHIDADNCTACGTKCAYPNAAAGCSDGCYIKACDFGYADCNNDMDNKDGCEMPVASDPNHCGDCTTKCMGKPHASATCMNSSCLLTHCDPGYTDCNGDSTDGCEVATGTDPNNCGACGNVCQQNLICKNGGCTCAMCNIPNSKTACVNNQCVFDSCLAGFADCNNNTKDGCEVNIGADGANCGGCGMVCPMNSPNCFNAMCMMGFTHHDGLGHTWVDNVPVGTYTIGQAAMACMVYVKQGLGGNDTCSLMGCGCGGQDSCVYNIMANPRYTWFYNNGMMGGQVTMNCCGCMPAGKWD